jgi:Cu/Ag efflux protein CusF
MKTILKLTSAAILSFGLASGALAVEYTKGVIKKVDAKAKKVTIIHEELKNLEMPAMTMVFRVKDDAMFEKMKEGLAVEFVANRMDGKLTVTELR